MTMAHLGCDRFRLAAYSSKAKSAAVVRSSDSHSYSSKKISVVASWMDWKLNWGSVRMIGLEKLMLAQFLPNV